ncbi:hypothetical protein DL93DRAFT_2080432 [Clavulina sp. PMI_390]|nr:hypothetical protein DL93DRAFT_2080432 [Clavulina sp. PMI_390]
MEGERPASKSLRYGYFDVGDAAARLSKARSNLTATAIAWSSSTSTKPAPAGSTPHSRSASNDSNTDRPRSQSQSNGHSRMGSITSATGSLSKFDVRSWMSGTSMGMTRSSTASSTASDRDADSRRSSSSAQSGNGRKGDSWGTTSRHVRIESASSDVSLIAPSLVHDGDDGDDSQLATYRNRMPISTPMAIAMAMRERASLPPLPSPPSGTASDFQTSPALPPPPTTPNNPRTLPDSNGGTRVSPHARSPSLPYGTSLASPFLRARTPQPPPTTPLSQNQTLGMPEPMPRSPLPSPTPSSSSIGSKSTPRGSGVRPLILSNRRVTRDSVSPGPAAGSLSRQSSLSSRASDAENAPSRIVPLNRRRRVVGTAHSASGSVVGSVSGSPIQSPSMSGRMLVSPTSEPRSSASAEEMMLAAADDFGVLVPIGKAPSSAPAAVAGAPQLSLPPSSSLHPPGVDDTELDIPDFDENNEGRDRRATIVPTRNSNGSAQSHSPSTTNPGPPTPTDSPEREGVAVWRESSASASSLSAAPISHVARRGATLPDAMSSKELVGMALEGTKGVQPKDDDRSFALRGSPSLQRQTRLRAKRSLKNVSPLDAIAPRSMTLPAASSHTNITAAPVVNGAGPSALAKHSLVPSPQYGDSDEDEGVNGLGAVFGGDREKMMHSLSVPSNGTPGIGSSSLGSLVGSPITPRQTLYADDPSPRSHSRSPSPSPNAAIGGSLARRPSPKPRRTRKVSNRKDSKQQDTSAVEEQDDGAGMSVPHMQSEEEGVKGDDEGDGDYEDLLSAYSTDADQA